MELLNAVGHYQERGELARAGAPGSARDRSAGALADRAAYLPQPVVRTRAQRAIIDERWPQPDAQALAQAMVELVVQVNGKLRARMQLPAGTEREAAVDAALADPTVQRFVAGKACARRSTCPTNS
jgi:leucyl-tRNA synthetase